MNIRLELVDKARTIICAHENVHFGKTEICVTLAAEFCADMRRLQAYLIDRESLKDITLVKSWGKLLITDVDPFRNSIFLIFCPDEPLSIFREELRPLISELELMCLEAAKFHSLKSTAR